MTESSGRWLPAAVAAFLLVATLGEGGGSPEGLLAVHTGLVVLLLAALAAGRSEEGSGSGRLAPAPAVFYGLFLVIAGVSAAVSPYSFAAVLAWIELFVFLASCWLGARCGPGALEFFSLALLSGGGVQGLVAVLQAASGKERPAGTFLNPNHLGAWLVAALLVAAPGLVASRGRPLFLRLALAAPLLGGLYVAKSRGALLALAAGASFLLWRERARLSGRVRVVALAAAAALVLLLAAGLLSRLGDPFSYHRVRIWGASFGLALEHPLLGVGPGQFGAISDALRFAVEEGPLRFERRFSTTHSDWIRLPVEVGWPATLLVAVAIASAAGSIRARLRFPVSPAGTGAAAALIGFLTQAAVDNLSERPAVYLLVGVLVGALVSEPARACRQSPTVRLLAAGFLLFAYVFGELVPYGAYSVSRGLPKGRLDPASRARLARALERNPLHPDLWMRRAEDLAGAGVDLSFERYGEAREASERAVRLDPWDASYRVRRARIEALACLALFRDEQSRARAAALYDEAVRLSPKDATILLEKGRFLLEAGDPSAARRAAEQALRLEPDAVTLRVLLAEALLVSGEPADLLLARHAFGEAIARAERWAREPRASGYARVLLDPDPGAVSRLARALARSKPAPRLPRRGFRGVRSLADPERLEGVRTFRRSPQKRRSC